MEKTDAENICLNCKHFRIWDDDPCCLEKDEFKIVLPTDTCTKYEHETFKPVLRLHREMWQESKIEFFKRYNIDKQLAEHYLEYFPNDRDLITIS